MHKILYILLFFAMFSINLYSIDKVEKVYLELPWLGQFQFAGYYIAKEKGFYTDVGLDIDIHKYDKNRTSFEKVISNKATYGIDNSSLIIKIDQGAKIVLLNAISQSSSISILSKKYDLDFYEDILFTSTDEALKHRQRVIKFKNASLKGWQYAFDNIDETIELILRKYNEQNRPRNAFLFEANELRKLAYYKTDKIGNIDKKKIEKIYNYYKDKGLAHNNIDITRYIFKDKNNIYFTKEEREYISKYQTIRYVYDPDWRPFEWKNGLNEHTGIIADILKLLSHRSGINFEAINTNTWAKSVELMKSKQADMYSAVPITQNREKYLNFTSANIYSYPAVLISKDDNELVLDNIQESLKDKTIGIIRGNSLGKYIKNRYPQAKFIELDSMEDGFDELKTKKIDLYAINAVSANYYINNKGYKNIKIFAYTDYMFKLKIALQKEMPKELLSILNKSLQDISEKEKKSIFLKWTTLKIQKDTDWTIIWKILLLGSFLLLVFLYISSRQIRHNRVLSKEISERIKAEKKLEEINTTLDVRVKSAIHELKEKNEKLQNANSNFEELLNSTIELIFISDENQKIIEANSVALEVFGIKSIKQLKYITLFDNLEKSSKDIVTKALKKAISHPYEISIYIKGRGMVPMLASGKDIIRDGKKMRISNLIDISKLKEAQHQLIQQSRLAQMGEMISMIAHQWRQPLSAISATSASINLKANIGTLDKDSAIKLSENITQYTHHLSTTINDFRNFFKENKTKETATIQEIVNATLNIVELSLKNAHIDLVTEFNSDVEIQTYANEVQQVVLNIIQNAQDALIEKKIQNPQIVIKVQDTTLSISDNAGGVPEDIIDKIFDPYFSTKTKKDGTGLGLYMSKTIIHEHCNGKLSVFNGEYGAIFKIVL